MLTAQGSCDHRQVLLLERVDNVLLTWGKSRRLLEYRHALYVRSFPQPALWPGLVDVHRYFQSHLHDAVRCRPVAPYSRDVVRAYGPAWALVGQVSVATHKVEGGAVYPVVGGGI